MINYKSRVFLLCLLCKIFFFLNIDSKNQILFLFCRPTNRIFFFAALPVDQKIKESAEKGNESGALLTAILKSFDCINPKLLISKLFWYGFPPL